jgi:hypothetical protein
MSYGLGGVIATPAILLENPGRLIELNIFCSTKILEIIILYFYQNKIMVYSRYFDIYERLVETIVMAPTIGALSTIVDLYPFALNGILAPAFYWILKGNLNK